METRIVVIDNDDSMRDLVSLCLKAEGRQIFSYAYAQINLAALEELRPDLIILDFNLRDDGIGWMFLQALKMEDAIAKTPILITTSQLYLSAEIQGFLLAQTISVIQKPFDINTLLTLVQEVLTPTSATGVTVSDRSLPILVVDDTESLRDTVAEVLRLEGYLVVTAENGEVALDIVSRGRYSLILLDIDMPIMSGYEFLSAYGHEPRPHIPVLIVSGEQEIQPRILPHFVVGVISKPFEFGHLLRAVGAFAQPV